MKWSWRIGRLAGIDLKVHATFVLIVAWVAFSQWLAGHGLDGVLSGIFFMLLLFGCVVLHELGHALAARTVGVGTRDIILLPIGGLARLGDRGVGQGDQELLATDPRHQVIGAKLS